MKKNNLLAIIISVFLAVICFSLAGCNEIYVQFDPDGGSIISGDSTAVYKKDETPVTAPEVSREGYVFLGWDKDYGTPETDITVKARWDKLYTITFDIIPDDTADDTKQIKTSSDKVEYPADPTREGYVFDGWDKKIETVNEDTVITAKWKKLYTVTFNLNGGRTTHTALLSQTVVEGESAKAPDATMEYMEPVEWDKDFSNVTSDIEVTAIWHRRELTSTEVAKLISPATVEVNTYRRNNAEWATGSGFFIDDSGTFITNYHVIENAYEIKVKLEDGTVYPVIDIVAFDKKLDIAILSIGRPTPNYLEFAETEPVKGDVVYAIGSSLGLDGTFTSGLVSTVSREIEGQKYIQTSAAISHGNSGGPLVNTRGFVIGINTLTAEAGQNLNFAIPISNVKNLKENRMTVRTWFDNYVTLQWWIFEKVVTEKNATTSITIQMLNTGETVNAVCSGSKDYDFYYLRSFKKYDSNGVELPVDLYIYYYTEDVNNFLVTNIALCSMKVSTMTIVKEIDYDYFNIYQYGNGYMLCMGVFDIFNKGVDFANSDICFGVSTSLSNSYQYNVFMMQTTDTSVRDNPY
jgi:hypothetical protein